MILKLKKINFTAIKRKGGKGYKYFIGYLYNDHKVKPLHIMIPTTSAYVKGSVGQTKWIYLLIEDDNLVEKYKPF